MKKRILTIIITTMMMFSLAGCATTEIRSDGINTTSMFVIIEQTGAWDVVYHKETKMMYVISEGYYNQGTFTLLVDAEGNPLLYEE